MVLPCPSLYAILYAYPYIYIYICICVCQKRTEKHVFVFDHILSEKHLRFLDKKCSRVKFKTIHPSSRPNSCFPVAYCSASPQGIPSKYIRAHAFAWRDGREQTRVRELKSRSQKAFVFSFYWGAEHAGLCLKFNIEKEIDSKKNVDLNWNLFWLNFKPNDINPKVISIQI